MKERGLFASLSNLLATLLEVAQVRLELLGTEVELEKRRLFDGILWGALALLALGVSFVLLCGLIILLMWEGYRLTAVGMMTLLFLILGVLLMRKARQQLRTPAGMFKASISELAQDQSSLKSSSQNEQ